MSKRVNNKKGPKNRKRFMHGRNRGLHAHHHHAWKYCSHVGPKTPKANPAEKGTISIKKKEPVIGTAKKPSFLQRILGVSRSQQKTIGRG